MQAPSLPRTLVIGQPFSSSTGGGITISSLFADWPAASLAVATWPHFDIASPLCRDYFLFGPDEDHIIWPLSRFRSRRRHGPVVREGERLDSSRGTRAAAPHSLARAVRHTAERTADALGVAEYVRTLRLTERLEAWITTFAPDVLYSQLSSLSLIEFVASVLQRHRLPLVLHFMDDWPRTACTTGLLSSPARRRLLTGLSELIERSGATLCIGEAMCDEYAARYAREFLPFQNCISLDQWGGPPERRWQTDGSLTIGYAGRIGTANLRSLLATARAIGELARRGVPVTLKAILSNAASREAAWLARCAGVDVLPPIAYDAMPGFLRSMDALLLPLDFDARSRDFARYSMPTKLPEYLASGTPIVVLAPEEMALTQYVASRQCAMCVTSDSPDALAAAVQRLAGDEPLRRRLGTTAMAVASAEHDERVVRARFETVLRRVTEAE